MVSMRSSVCLTKFVVGFTAAFLAAFIAVPLGLPVPALALGPNDRRLTHVRSGISVEAPSGWSLSQHTGFADTIVLLLHPDGSRISVSAAGTDLRNADGLFKQNRPGLIAQGLTPTVVAPGPRGSLAVDLSASPGSGAAAGRSDRMRQLYLVRDVPRGRQAIVLTLVTSTSSFAARASALEFVATRLTFDDPVSPSAPPRGTGAASAGGGASGGAAAPPR